MEIMNQQEGVIKFHLQYTQVSPIPWDSLREINAWRSILYRTQLIGKDPNRYDGAGYGNISQRIAPFDTPKHQRPFVISGTQTGGMAILTEMHYTMVTKCNPYQNQVSSEGPIKPSSESLTHGILYDLDHRLRFVMHVHSPHIWRKADILQMLRTKEGVIFGTPEMAEEIRRLFEDTQVRSRHIFAMGGHEDGIVSFGRTSEEAGSVLINTLARAYQLGDRA